CLNFFFSSRRRHTRFSRDWSSDVCSSDLIARGFTPMSADEMQALRERCAQAAADGRFELYKTSKRHDGPTGRKQHHYASPEELRSEERRVGKECRIRGAT